MWIIAYWLGVTVVALTDLVIWFFNVINRVGLRLCTAARDNGYDFSLRLPERVVEEEEAEDAPTEPAAEADDEAPSFLKTA